MSMIMVKNIGTRSRWELNSHRMLLASSTGAVILVCWFIFLGSAVEGWSWVSEERSRITKLSVDLQLLELESGEIEQGALFARSEGTSVLDRLEGLAGRLSLELRSFTREEPISHGPVLERRGSIVLIGSFQELLNFLEQLERNAPELLISELRISSDPESRGLDTDLTRVVTLSCTISQIEAADLSRGIERRPQ